MSVQARSIEVLPVGQLLLHGRVELVDPVRPDDVVDAAHRRAVAASGRPGRHHVQVVGQRPRLHRLEHVVVEHEVLGVGPVVGYLRGGVVAHHVGRAARGCTPGRRGCCRSTGPASRCWMNPFILPPFDVGDRVGLAVRAAAVDVGGVVVGPGAPAAGVRHAHRRLPVAHRDAVRAGVGPEVAVERPVLLHHDDHVLDLVDPGGHQVRAVRAAADDLARMLGRGHRLGRGRRRRRRRARGQQGSDEHAGRHDATGE